jgi:hypothetical protein
MLNWKPLDMFQDGMACLRRGHLKTLPYTSGPLLEAALSGPSPRMFTTERSDGSQALRGKMECRE